MFKKYTDVFSQTYLDRARSALYTLHNNGKLPYENASIIKNCFGMVNIPETLEVNAIKALNEIVVRDFGTNYQFTHTFSRINFNEAVLMPHTDRDGLDLTGSLTIYHNLTKPWYINVANNKVKGDDTDHTSFLDSYNSVDIKINELLLFKAREHIHWREPLICNHDQHCMHIFYHWKLIE
jgi:hypothetical protein